MNGFKFWIGKIVGIAAGAGLGGYVGGMIGLVIGAILDKLHKDGGELWLNKSAPAKVEDTDPNDFVVGSILLAGAVVKADGEVDDLELSYVRSFLVEQFGTRQMDDYWHILMESINNDFDLKKTTQQIRRTTSYETRLQLIHFLFGIANADYSIDEPEIAAIKVISIHLGVEAGEFDSIKAMFYHAMDAYYKILEISPSARDEEVREAYHYMLKKYHPDKLEHLGEGVKRAATAKFIKVKEAYEGIRKERGFK
ncbi:TerB family tellurite resistance protein [Aureispira anguillae]|uniref:TerB family tellurite resistance protein n=1 Tax=Aureispira anguillae TaxID=2864201 RepID=A0A915YE64_9BACT|nr:TerB family tellurite resistance protein [Aureispira anguillae]BDS11400.1 TerB family tellurite resistance protein [Aureispira anguillae]